MNSPCLFIQRLGVESLKIKCGPSMTAAEVTREVAGKYGLTVNELRGPSRVRGIVHPRQEAMALIYAQGRLSLPRIGRFFGRDHTTILHGIRQHAKRLEEARVGG